MAGATVASCGRRALEVRLPACHEALRRWVYRAIPVHPIHRFLPVANANQGSVAGCLGNGQKNVDCTFQIVRRALSSLALVFPVVAIPWLEVQRIRIGQLESEVEERGRQIQQLRSELDAAWQTNPAAASG